MPDTWDLMEQRIRNKVQPKMDIQWQWLPLAILVSVPWFIGIYTIIGWMMK